VLDILAGEGVRGSFFLVGRRAAAIPSLARRIAEEGHDVGNHTWAHRSLWLLGPRATRREVRDGHLAVSQASGTAPRFFRAPWGMINLALFPILRALRTPCVFWSVQPEGLRAAGGALQIARAVRRCHPGAIIGLHDANGVPGAGRRLLDALPGLIRHLRDGGYAFSPLRDLL